MPPACLFISYRRDDSAGYARALHEAMAAAYGHERVFIDVDDIGAGQRFVEVIQQALGSAAVLLVLIGPRWAGPRAGAAARIHDADDFVRREVEASLHQGLHVVPVLLDNTPLPSPADLPPSLHPLLERNALSLASQGFRADLAELLAALQPLMGPHAPAPSAGQGTPASPRRTVLLVGSLLLTAAVAGGAWYGWSQRGPTLQVWAGDWVAEVNYPWSNARYNEQISLQVEGDTLSGSASFLRVPRTIGDVQWADPVLVFSTRTTSISGDERWENVHRYRLERRPDGLLDVQLQTQSQGVAQRPLRFTVKRVAAVPAP